MEFGQIPMAPTLSDALNQAFEVAVATRHGELSLEHLLYALCDDPDAIAVLDASRVDIARLKMETAAFLSGREPKAVAQDQPPAVSEDVARILEAANAAARGGRRRDINGAIVLAAIVGDGRSAAAQLLHNLGLTFDAAIRALQQALAPPTPLREAPAVAPAEDVLARARERVQSRSAPTLREMRGGMAPQPSARHPHYEAEPPAKFEPYFETETHPAAPATEAQPSAEDAGPSLDAPKPDPGLPFPGEVEAAEAQRPSDELGGAVQSEAAMDEAFAKLGASTPSRLPDDFAPRPTESPSQGSISFEIPRPVPVQPPPIPRASPAGVPMAPDDRPPTSPHAPWPDAYIPPSAPSYADIAAGREPTFDSAPPQAAYPSQSESAPTPFDPVPATPPYSPAPQRERGAIATAGQLAENIPRSMRVGDTERVEVRIAKASLQELAAGLEGGGAAWRHDIIITKAMSVRLRAPDGGFFIETASPETQWIENQLGITNDDFASWRFLITPQERGRTHLLIIISARTVGSDGVAAETALPDQMIDVQVTTNYARAAKKWSGWIAAAVVGGALAKFGEAGLDAANMYLAKFVG
jgi:hypothetical protein